MAGNGADKESKLGTVDIEKGGELVKGKQLYMWDAASPCKHTQCRIFEICPYVKQKDCVVEKRYLHVAFNQIIVNHGEDLTESQLYRAGTLIIPLYAQLIKLKILELSVPSPLTYSSKGDVKIHPVYKEIREIIQHINRTFLSVFSFIPEWEVGGGKGSPKSVGQ